MATRVPSFKGAVGAFRTPGIAVADAPYLSIFNKTGSGVLVAISQLTLQAEIESGGNANKTVRITRITSAPTDGTLLTPVAFDTSQTHNTNVEIRASASADSTTGTFTAAPTAANLSNRTAAYIGTLAGQHVWTQGEAVPRYPQPDDPVVLGEGEGIVVTAGPAGLITHFYQFNAAIEEFTYDAGGTNAPAEVATGTGAALNASVKVAATGGLATGTGAAPNAAAHLKPNASNASGTGAAGGSTSTVSPTAGHAAGTGAANNATGQTSVTGTAGHASGTGAASNASTAIAASAIAAAGTGTAHGANGAEDASAIIATGTGQAFDATVTTATATNAAAGHASGTGAAYDATASTESATSANAGHAAGIGAAYDSTVVVVADGTASAEAASGTGSALNPSLSLATGASGAGGTGAVGGSTSTLAVGALTATGTGAANDATAQTGNFTVAQAETATGTGSAFDATVSAVSGVVEGGSPGSSFDPRHRYVRQPSRRYPAPVPVLVYARAEVAQGFGDAYKARTTWDDDEYALLLLLDVA